MMALERGDRVFFRRVLVAGPDPHPVQMGIVVEASEQTLRIRLPGQRELYRGLRSEIERAVV